MNAASLAHFLKRSLWKDMRYSFFPIMRALLGFVILISIILLGFANGYAFSEDKLTHRYEPDDHLNDYEFIGIDEDENDHSTGEFGMESEIYLILNRGATEAAFFSFLAFFIPMLIFLILLHVSTLTMEIVRGNIRSFFHYDLSFRQVMFSKMMNICLMMLILTVIFSYLVITSLLVWDLIFLFIIGLILLTFIFLIGQYIFFFCIMDLVQRTGIKKFFTDPLPLMIIGNLFFLFLTETALHGTYSLLAEIFKWTNNDTGFLVLKYLSPFHTYGVFIDLYVYGTPIEILDLIWVPIFTGVIVATIMIKKKVYPDVFIKETA